MDQDKPGEAAAKLELAAEAFRATGDSTQEAQALKILEEQYIRLGECPLEAVRERIQFLSEENSASDAPSTPSRANRFMASFINILGSGIRDQQQVEKDKRALRELVAKVQTQDDNERYLQRHLVQVRFDQLPFAKVEQRVTKSALASLDALEEHAQRVYTSTQEMAYLLAPQKQKKASSQPKRRHAETYLAFMDEWDDSQSAWADTASQLMQRLKDQVVGPLATLRSTYSALCKHFVSQRAQYVRYVYEAQDHRSQEEFNERNGDLSDIPRAIQRLLATQGALEAAHQRSCRELQLIDQSRIEVMAHLTQVLLETQNEVAQNWQKSTQQALASLGNVEAASDIRAFSNRTLLASVLDGQNPPEVLLQASDIHQPPHDSAVKEPNSGTVESELDVSTGHNAATVPPGESASSSHAKSSVADDEHVQEASDDSPVSPTSSQLDPAVKMFTEHLRNGLDAPDETIHQLCETFRNPKIRRDFLLALNRLRAQQTRLTSLNQLVLLMIAFLDAVYIQGDVRSAKMALILAETFYTFEDDSENGINQQEHESSTMARNEASNDKEELSFANKKRVYVQDHIKDHGIWKSPHFWEETFFLALREEVYRNISSSVGSSNGHAEPALQQPNLSSANFTHIAFAQISSSAFNMTSLGLPPAQVGRFLLHAALFAGLDQNRLEDLQLRLGTETESATP